MVLLLAGSLGCASSDLLLPDPPGGGENVTLSKVAGDNQTGTVGEQLPEPLVVQVLSQSEQPVSGRQVSFVLTSDPAAGQVTPEIATTNAAGQAIARWVLGTAPGSHSVTARLVEDNGETQFTAAAKASTPDTLAAHSPVVQPGARRQIVREPPVVRVADKYGNPVPEVSVAWQVVSGEGSVSEPITQTGPDGTATVEWTLGDRIGVQKLTAAIGAVTGSPVTFTVSILF